MTDPPPDATTTPDPLAVWWRLHRAALVLRLLLRDALAPLGVTPAQAEVVLALRAHTDAAAPLTPMRLARALHLAPPNLTMVADVLVQRGLVQRDYDLVDRRRVQLRLTPMGAALADMVQPVLQAALAQAFHDLAEHEMAELVRLLGRLGPGSAD